jgi:palmitoyltransferase
MSSSDTVSQQPTVAAPAKMDPSKLDAVRAAQFGHLERLRQLVEEGGLDVRQPDAENVTLLHWAAINNRSAVVAYLLKRGAEVDAVGGDLRSTALHWAVRQGLLPMVVQLLRHGADPLLRDGEGCACLHVAAQIGHTAVAAYLVAKGTDVNLQDDKGMTPLAW